MQDNQCAIIGDSDQPALIPPRVSVTVVICTYNRCDKLRQALKAIDRVNHPSNASIDLVVIDNNSSDSTRETVEEFSRASTLPVRYVFESVQGHLFARNRGLREATGDIIAFTDDDCIVDPDWITAIVREFETRPDLILIGGRVDLHSPEDRPISIRPFDKRVRYAGAGQVFSRIIGCNMAFRRELVERIGGFDPPFGEGRGVVGEDIDFVYRAVRQGLAVEFVPDIVVRHDHGRRSDEEIKNLSATYIRSRGAFYAKYALRNDRDIMQHAYWEVMQELRGILEGLRSRRSVAANFWRLGKLASGGLWLVRARLRMDGSWPAIGAKNSLSNRVPRLHKL